MTTFAESRRRHDERYWSEVWTESGGSLTAAAKIAGVLRPQARHHLELHGIRARKDALVPRTAVLLRCLRQPDAVERIGRVVTTAEIEALTVAQRVAVNLWLLACEDQSTHLTDRVVPGFLLLPEQLAEAS